MKRLLLAACLMLVAVAGLAVYQLAAPRSTPAPQPRLTSIGTLSRDDVGAVRDQFNASADSLRLLVMLSPT